MPRIIVINKMDAENVIFPELIKNIQETFGQQCRCANLPASDKASVIDCIENESGESPLMDVALARGQFAEAAAHGRALLDPQQQRLPDPLAASLEKALSAWDAGKVAIARRCLEQSVALAREFGGL